MRFPFFPVVNPRKGNRRRLQLESLESRAMLAVVAQGGGGYFVFEGDSLTLDASGSTSTGVPIHSIAWDLDNDGAFDDHVNNAVDPNNPNDLMLTLTWSQLVTLGIADSQFPNDLHTFGVLVTAGVESDDDFQEFQVFNIDPTLGQASYVQESGGGGSGCGGEGGVPGVVHFTGTFTDPGWNETYTITIDWDGDENDDETEDGVVVNAPSIIENPDGSYTVTASYSYAAAGTKTVTWSVSDGEGSAVESTLLVDAVGGGGSPSGPSVCFDETSGEVTVTGSTTQDNVFVSREGDMVRISASFLTNEDQYVEFPANSVIEIHAILGAGNDVFAIANNVDVAVVVAGGEGNDILSGGPGRSILIGGAGSDALVGGGGEDLLIGGTTDFDTDSAALIAILTEWNADRDIDVRIRNLVDGSGTPDERENGNHFLVAGETVDNDNQIDLILGGSGEDWLFMNGLLERLLALGSGQDYIGSNLDNL